MYASEMNCALDIVWVSVHCLHKNKFRGSWVLVHIASIWTRCTSWSSYPFLCNILGLTQPLSFMAQLYDCLGPALNLEKICIFCSHRKLYPYLYGHCRAGLGRIPSSGENLFKVVHTDHTLERAKIFALKCIYLRSSHR